MRVLFSSVCATAALAIMVSGCGGSSSGVGSNPINTNGPGGGIAPHYRITAIGVAGSGSFTPTAVNASEQVVGSTSTEAAIWTPASNGLTNISGGFRVAPTGINDAGLIVGTMTGDSAITYGCYWSPGSTTPTQVVAPQFLNFQFNSVNNSGEIAGSGDTLPDLTSYATIWNVNNIGQPVTLNGLITPTVSTYAVSINDSHQIVGQAESDGGLLPVYWGSATANPFPQSVIQGEAAPTAINSKGQIIATGLNVAAYWPQTGSLEDVLSKQGAALGINGMGIVVGNYTITGGTTVASVWTPVAGLVNLNSLLDSSSKTAGWTLTSATAINASGWIVGVGTVNGKASGFIAQPLPQ